MKSGLNRRDLMGAAAAGGALALWQGLPAQAEQKKGVDGQLGDGKIYLHRVTERRRSGAVAA